MPTELLGERIVVVVPMVGKGTLDDPICPKHTPVAMSAALFASEIALLEARDSGCRDRSPRPDPQVL